MWYTSNDSERFKKVVNAAVALGYQLPEGFDLAACDLDDLQGGLRNFIADNATPIEVEAELDGTHLGAELPTGELYEADGEFITPKPGKTKYIADSVVGEDGNFYHLVVHLH